MLTPGYQPNAGFQESQMETVLKRSSRVMMMSGMRERDNIIDTKFVLVPTARCRVCGVERGCTWVYT
jgi:hypothetical protein